MLRAPAPGKAHHAEPAASGRRGNGDDGVGKVHAALVRHARAGAAAFDDHRSRPLGASVAPDKWRRRKFGQAGHARGIDHHLPVSARAARFTAQVVSLRSARWMTRRSRLFMGLKRNGCPVRFTFSAAAAALSRSSSMRSRR